MAKYQTKYNQVNAYLITQVSPTSNDGITEVLVADCARTIKIKQEKSEIVTHQIAVGDYVVEEVNYFSCPKDIFEDKYEPSKTREKDRTLQN